MPRVQRRRPANETTQHGRVSAGEGAADAVGTDVSGGLRPQYQPLACLKDQALHGEP